MKVTELQLGDIVKCGDKGIPMQVVGLFKDVAYLDFEGNEGDMWEVDEEDLRPIPITQGILEKNGFKNGHFFGELITNGCVIQHDCENVRIRLENKEMVDIPCEYVHELQHVLRLCKIEKEIKL